MRLDMNYITWTQQYHAASKEQQLTLKQQYPHYYTHMMNRAWSVIAMIRARKKDKVVDIDPQIS